MKTIVCFLGLISFSALAAVPRNAECVLKKEAVKCSKTSKKMDGYLTSVSTFTCHRPVLFRLADGSSKVSSLKANGSADVNLAGAVLTLGQTAYESYLEAQKEAVKEIAVQLEDYELCSRFDRS